MARPISVITQKLKAFSVGLDTPAMDNKNSDGSDHSADEAGDHLPSLTVNHQKVFTGGSSMIQYEEDTLEFVDMMVPSSAKSRRRKSSLVRKFSVGSFADSIKIELGEECASVNSHFDGGNDGESVVFASNDIDEEDGSNAIFNPRISDFEPLKVLGQGAYGKVLLVRNKESGKLFAQKQLKKASILVSAKNQSSLMSKNNDEQVDSVNIGKKIERTMAERDILARIKNPFIVKLFYALQDVSKIYLYLEFVPGGELFHHLSSNSNFLDEKATAFYAAEMTLALRHLHEIGIVYRDLKPENCLLDSSGHLILTDFGLSKISTEQDSKCNSIIGTPEYMAPEVLRGEDYSFSVDWWSLGTVIYDMLSGKPPFTGGNHKAICNKILKNKIKYPFYFTNESKDLLNKLLNKNPDKRMNVDTDFEKFKKLRFFRSVQWELLADENEYKSVKAPILPLITDPVLAENFDDEFTSMKISNYDIIQTEGDAIPDDEIDHEVFKGFSYTASSSYIKKFL
ncbi:putative protein kinase [Saccharomycopsis crataegensis]|uniref:Uncharacterized protein n=1 Tax=Saccharomycopsis crataegensis TaxID=43959 RepID=A0AAV5QVP8_9ASCO|nr:putative protein kinase [Saccharomycopsis crataegensis]